MEKSKKYLRVVYFIMRLMQEKLVSRNLYMEQFEIAERTFRRDKQEVFALCREWVSEKDALQEKEIGGDTLFFCPARQKNLGHADILVVLKNLVSSRALAKEEMMHLKNLLMAEVPDQRTMEQYMQTDVNQYTPLNYVPSMEKQALSAYAEQEVKQYNQGHMPYSQKIWELEKVILKKKKLTLKYQKADGEVIAAQLVPLDILFSEFYFYLVLLSEEEPERYFFYRVDRILDFSVLQECDVSEMVYESHQIADLKRLTVFMQTGEKLRVVFRFWGKSLAAVMDRLPTAKVIGEEDGKSIVGSVHIGEG